MQKAGLVVPGRGKEGAPDGEEAAGLLRAKHRSQARVFLAGPRGRPGTPPAVQTRLSLWKGIRDARLVGRGLELGCQAHYVPGWEAEPQDGRHLSRDASCCRSSMNCAPDSTRGPHSGRGTEAPGGAGCRGLTGP